MKVKDLQEGQLYIIDTDSRVVVIVARENHLDIVKARGPVRWERDKKSLKGRPALYCGVEKRESDYCAQGWFKIHKFLISGEYYNIHGDSMRNIKELS